MRIAAIDVGSNSIHMVVVEADPMGGQHVLARDKAMVRLAKGEAKSGEISPEAVTRVGPSRSGVSLPRS